MLVRFLAVVGGTAVVAFAGFFSGRALQSWLGTELIAQAVQVGAIAASLWAFLKHLLENFEGLVRYVLYGKSDPLVRATIQGLIILFVGGLTFGIQKPSTPPSLVAISQLMAGEPSEIVVLEERFSIPFHVGRVEGTGCDVETTTWGKGTEIGVEQETVLGRLAEAFRACSAKGDSERVVVDVRGFASSRDFACLDGDPDHSKAMNLALSEARRRAVIRVLRKAEKSPADSFGIVDEHEKRWGGRWDEMRANLGFSDRGPSGNVIGTRETLTRRVDIVVLKKGLCGPR